MRSHTAYMTFETEQRRALIRITDDVQAAVDEAGISEGMVLVSAMHITAGVWINRRLPPPPERRRGQRRRPPEEPPSRRAKRLVIKAMGE